MPSMLMSLPLAHRRFNHNMGVVVVFLEILFLHITETRILHFDCFKK